MPPASTHSQSPTTDRKHYSPTSDSVRDDDEQPENDSTTAKSKRRSTTSTIHDEENGKKKRRKVNHACVYCRRSHMTCDLQRPCARCIKRDIGHLCHDEPRDPPKRNKSDMGVPEIAPAPDGAAKDGSGAGNGAFAQAGVDMQPSVQMAGAVNAALNGATHAPPFAQPSPVSPAQLQKAGTNGSNGSGPGGFMPNTFDWNNTETPSQFHDVQHLHPNYMFSNSEVTNEYNMLNDFLSNSLVDDGALYNYDSDAHQTFMNDPLLATSSLNAMNNMHGLLPLQQAQHQALLSNNDHMPAPAQTPMQDELQTPSQNRKAGEEISRPSSAFPISEQTLNKFYMTAADPAGLDSAEDRLHKLLKAKHDAGMLKPYNYVKAYARLNTYMGQNLSRESQVRIMRQLDRFRPKFREATQKLTDMQLVLVEMWFERSLLEYDRVFASMAIPACCWRRTGEIFRGNREMAELIGVPWENLRDGRLTIHEIIAEDSLVSYWEKFGAIAFDQSQKAILTSCSLKTPKWDVGDSCGMPMGQGGGTVDSEDSSDSRQCRVGTGGQGPGGGKSKKSETGTETVKCCFSFTIRRDTHNIPALIVGNFLPIRQRPFCTYQASRPV